MSRSRHAPDTLARADTWRDHAACRDEDPELFFPDPTDLVGLETARSICRGCSAAHACAAWAIAHRIDHGVWGGMTAEERRRRRTARPREAA